jgi:tetratricopeptide (TPR) repeat protein
VRANICRWIEQFDESIALARRAAEVFLRFGDRQAAVNARMYEGATLFQLRNYAGALEIWKAIEHDPGLTSDTQRIGLVQNLGICYRETGELGKAAEYLSRAAAEFELVGNETNRVRSRWGLASTLSAAARHEQAIPLLREVWREFESLGLEADAALVALELAESLLVTNRADEVPAICRTLLDRFTQSGMSERAVVALAFLRESVASGHATPVHVRHVHDFLRDIPVEGERLFAPPPLNTL